MRFDELVLRVPGEELRIGFHERLTVLAGVGALDRQALVRAVLGAMTGDGDTSVLTGVDHTGRPVEITADNGHVSARYTDDGTAAPVPIGWFAPDAESLRDLMVLSADDLGPSSATVDRDDDPPELTEARSSLRAIAAELAEASEGQRRVDAVQAEITALQRRIHVAEGDAARREYARALADLERVRAEAAAIQSGVQGAENDRQLLAGTDEAHRLATRWSELANVTVAARARLESTGDGSVEPADVGRLVDVPDAIPADLPGLVAELSRAADHVQALEERLRVVASASLPDPEDGRILTLATVDQAELWAAHERAVEAAELMSREQVAMGGIGADGDRALAIGELEAAHAAAERAAEVIQRRLVKVVGTSALTALAGMLIGTGSAVVGIGTCLVALVIAGVGIGGPWVARSAAQRREARSLERVGVPTYLAFHLRRVDATLDPSILDRLGFAQAELAAAQRAWTSVAGDVPLDDAAALRRDVTAYAEALASQHGAVQEVAELRRSLDELALPDLARARERVQLAVEPYGLAAEDLEGLEPPLVLDLVHRQVRLARAARGQRALEDAEADEEKVAARLDDLLVRLGFGEGPLDARVGALDWAAARAAEREAARAAARPREQIEADLHRLNAEVRRLRRPEWTEVSANEADGPDLADLEAEKARLEAELAAAREAATAASGIDAERLADRHAALERRVTALEVQLRGERGESADVEELQRYLLAALTRANKVGPRSEPIPVLLDDPFSRVPAERKYELMDMLRRLSEKTQMLYMTDDAFIGAWARQRADDGAISLLEPVE